MTIEVHWHEPTEKFRLVAGLRDTERIREIPGARANTKKRYQPHVAVWSVPGTVETARRMAAIIPKATYTDEAKHRIRKMKARRKELIESYKRDIGEFAPVPGLSLSELQGQSANRLLQDSVVMAHDMGAGKTPIACVAAREAGFVTTLVIATKSTVGLWCDHLRAWAEIEPFLFHGTPKQRTAVLAAFEAHEGKKALVTTHALAGSNSSQASFGTTAAAGEPGVLNREWDLCIIDEAHKMGVDPHNKWVRSMWQIGKTSRVRWALTGTPVNDKPDDLWVLMNFVNPLVFGSRSEFRERYCIVKPQFFGGVLNIGLHPDTADEFQWCLRPWFIRRLKREMLLDLPPVLPTQYITLPLTTKQASAYKAISTQKMAMIEKRLYVAPDVLEQTQALEYIADGLPEIDDETGRVIRLYPDRKTSAKLDFIMDIAEQRNGDPFVVFAQSSKTADMIYEGMEEKFKVAKITGKVDQETRDVNVAMFQQGMIDCLVLTSAGSEGITLTAADLIIFARESWNAPTNQQTKDRIDRWGQERSPQTIVLLSENTIDQSRRAAVERKVNMQEQVLRDKKKVAALLDGTWKPEEAF